MLAMASPPDGVHRACRFERTTRYRTVAAKQVRHHGNAGIAGVVQAGKLKCRLDGFEQREAGVKPIAFHTIFAIAVQFHGEDDVVLVLQRKGPAVE